MPRPSIRHAELADAAALSSFAAAVFPLGCPETAPSDLASHIAAELSPARFHALIADPNVLVLLAESSATEPAAAAGIVAYTVALRSSPHAHFPGPAPAELRKLYLDPAHHGSGLADQLVQRVLTILDAENPRPIWLSVFSENPRAIAFYQRWGFQIAGSQEYVVGTDRQQDFLMVRTHAPAAGSGEAALSVAPAGGSPAPAAGNGKAALPDKAT
jgi:ribosomal protein S18 acetylase RimI-like enzyme